MLLRRLVEQDESAPRSGAVQGIEDQQAERLEAAGTLLGTQGKESRATIRVQTPTLPLQPPPQLPSRKNSKAPARLFHRSSTEKLRAPETRPSTSQRSSGVGLDRQIQTDNLGSKARPSKATIAAGASTGQADASLSLSDAMTITANSPAVTDKRTSARNAWRRICKNPRKDPLIAALIAMQPSKVPEFSSNARKSRVQRSKTDGETSETIKEEPNEAPTGATTTEDEKTVEEEPTGENDADASAVGEQVLAEIQKRLTEDPDSLGEVFEPELPAFHSRRSFSGPRTTSMMHAQRVFGAGAESPTRGSRLTPGRASLQSQVSDASPKMTPRNSAKNGNRDTIRNMVNISVQQAQDRQRKTLTLEDRKMKRLSESTRQELFAASRDLGMIRAIYNKAREFKVRHQETARPTIPINEVESGTESAAGQELLVPPRRSLALSRSRLKITHSMKNVVKATRAIRIEKRGIGVFDQAREEKRLSRRPSERPSSRRPSERPSEDPAHSASKGDLNAGEVSCTSDPDEDGGDTVEVTHKRRRSIVLNKISAVVKEVIGDIAEEDSEDARSSGHDSPRGRPSSPSSLKSKQSDREQEKSKRRGSGNLTSRFMRNQKLTKRGKREMDEARKSLHAAKHVMDLQRQAAEQFTRIKEVPNNLIKDHAAVAIARAQATVQKGRHILQVWDQQIAHLRECLIHVGIGKLPICASYHLMEIKALPEDDVELCDSCHVLMGEDVRSEAKMEYMWWCRTCIEPYVLCEKCGEANASDNAVQELQSLLPAEADWDLAFAQATAAIMDAKLTLAEEEKLVVQPPNKNSSDAFARRRSTLKPKEVNNATLAGKISHHMSLATSLAPARASAIFLSKLGKTSEGDAPRNSLRASRSSLGGSSCTSAFASSEYASPSFLLTSSGVQDDMAFHADGSARSVRSSVSSRMSISRSPFGLTPRGSLFGNISKLQFSHLSNHQHQEGMLAHFLAAKLGSRVGSRAPSKRGSVCLQEALGLPSWIQQPPMHYGATHNGTVHLGAAHHGDMHEEDGPRIDDLSFTQLVQINEHLRERPGILGEEATKELVARLQQHHNSQDLHDNHDQSDNQKHFLDVYEALKRAQDQARVRGLLQSPTAQYGDSDVSMDCVEVKGNSVHHSRRQTAEMMNLDIVVHDVHDCTRWTGDAGKPVLRSEMEEQVARGASPKGAGGRMAFCRAGDPQQNRRLHSPCSRPLSTPPVLAHAQSPSTRSPRPASSCDIEDVCCKRWHLPVSSLKSPREETSPFPKESDDSKRVKKQVAADRRAASVKEAEAAARRMMPHLTSEAQGDVQRESSIGAVIVEEQEEFEGTADDQTPAISGDVDDLLLHYLQPEKSWTSSSRMPSHTDGAILEAQAVVQRLLLPHVLCNTTPEFEDFSMRRSTVGGVVQACGRTSAPPSRSRTPLLAKGSMDLHIWRATAAAWGMRIANCETPMQQASDLAEAEEDVLSLQEWGEEAQQESKPMLDTALMSTAPPPESSSADPEKTTDFAYTFDGEALGVNLQLAVEGTEAKCTRGADHPNFPRTSPCPRITNSEASVHSMTEDCSQDYRSSAECASSSEAAAPNASLDLRGAALARVCFEAWSDITAEHKSAEFQALLSARVEVPELRSVNANEIELAQDEVLAADMEVAAADIRVDYEDNTLTRILHEAFDDAPVYISEDSGSSAVQACEEAPAAEASQQLTLCPENTVKSMQEQKAEQVDLPRWAADSPISLPTPCGRRPRTGDYWTEHRRAHRRDQRCCSHLDYDSAIGLSSWYQNGTLEGSAIEGSTAVKPSQPTSRGGRRSRGPTTRPLSIEQWAHHFQRCFRMPPD